MKTIDNHNIKLFNIIKNEQNKFRCNYRIKSECPVEGNCMVKDLVYVAKVQNSVNEESLYIGASKNKWQKRYYKHRLSSKHKKYENPKAQSAYYWII